MTLPKLKRKARKFWRKSARRLTFGGLKKIAVIVLMVGLNWAGLAAVGQTVSYFNDEENSIENTFSTGTLDFRLTNQIVSGFVGMENNGEIFHTSVAIPESGSMPMQYFVYSTSVSLVCSEFRVRVRQNETEIFNGPLPDFLSATTAVFGTWRFEFDLPIGTPVTQGDLCQANIIFSAWREEIENPEESGFFDIETLSLDLKAKTIVLNEILAHPNPNHPYPANREFIELKNNGNVPVDVAGWKVSEMTGGGVEKKYTIITAGGSYTASPYGGSTIIPAGGWLVLLLSDGTALNNDGDTIRLYDSGDNKLDGYSYEAAKYGMSDARYLDGVGEWVDPVPTPGRPNVLSGDETAPEEIAVENVASPSFSETLELAAGTVSEFVSGGLGETASGSQEVVTASGSFEIVASPSGGQGEIINPAPVASESVEPLAEPLIEPPLDSPDGDLTGQAPEPADDGSSIQTIEEPAIPVEPVTPSAGSGQAIEPPADPPLPTSPSENLGGQAAPAPEAPAAPAE